MDDGQVRERLGAAREAALVRLSTLGDELHDVVQAAAGSNLDDEHDPEGATIAFEREQLSTHRDRARRQLAELDAALVRLARGEYGRCVVCGRPIPAERLDARPAAETCVRCASPR